MADEIIGALRVVLGLDTAAFTSGTKDAESALSKLTSTFKTAAAGLAAGFTLGKIEESIKGVIDQAAEFQKVSEKFGIPVESLSALKYASEQVDVSFESLTKGLSKLSKSMLDSADPASKSAKGFAAIGLSASELRKLSPEDQLGAIADKFNTLAPGTDKAGIAIKLFGKAGAEMIPFLNLGSEGIERLTEKAKELGIVISADTAEKSLQFNQTLKDIAAVTQGLWIQVTVNLLPALQQLASAFLSAKREGSLFQSVISNLITDTDISELQRYVQYFENFVRVISALRNLPNAIKELGITQALDELDNVIALNKQALADLEKQLSNMPSFKGFLDNINEGIRAGEQYAASLNHVNTGVLAGKNALESFIESQQKSIAATNANAASLGKSADVVASLKVTMEAYAIATAHGITITDAMSAKIQKLGKDSGDAALNLKRSELTQEFLDPWDKYKQKVDEVNKALAGHPEFAKTAAAASAKAASDLTEGYVTAFGNIAGSFASLTDTLGAGNKEMFRVGQGLRIAEAIANTFVAYTKTLAQQGPLGLITGVAVIAAGLAAVAKIVATKPPGAARGGQFMVPGAGGTDTRITPIMATPGEKVSIDQNKYGESSGSAKTITLQGLKPKEYYRGDVLRDFVDNLNQAIGDGLKIKLA